MLQARQLSWRNSLREVRRHVAFSGTIEARHFSTNPRSLARHTPIDSPFAAQLLPRIHPRSFATSQIRRKDKGDKDDVPDAIPEAPEKEEHSDKEKPQSVSEKEAEREARKESGHGSSIKTIDPKGSAGASGASGESGGGDGSGSGFGKRGKRSMVPAKPSVPDIYPQVLAIPIAKRPLFPGFYKAFTIKDPNVAAALNEMIKRGQPYVGVFVFKDENLDKDTIDHPDEVYDVGVFAQITSQFPVHGEETSLTAVLYPHRRIRITSLIPPNKAKGEQFATASIEQQPEAASEGQEVVEAPPTPPATPPAAEPAVSKELTGKDKEGDVVASFEEGQSSSSSGEGTPYDPTSFLRDFPVSLVNVENIPEQPWDKKNNVIRAVTNEIVNVFKDVANLNPLFRDQISTFSVSQSAGNIMDEPGKLADFAAAVSSGEVHELQEVLETMDVEKRVQKALEVLKKELMNAQLQNKISKDVEGKIQKRQREYWLMEQMKGIRRELGIESDGKDKLVEKFREKASKLAMPDAVKKVFDEELNKLAHLEQAASEFNVTRNYLDWLTQIPWGQRSAENFGIKHAMTVLDEDHYGLKDVKDRILEFIAVGKLRGTVEGKILCFVGPPGVGKTSIGKSIARALGRQYYRFSVGGLADVAEIKGHRRTYVGALPGRIIQALKKCQTENPLILIDEIDKLGRGHQGDPASALLELLDPEQNNSFLDHYLDVPVDLSKVLFVCTANVVNTIPRPLYDRMEVIQLSGYVADEKMAIADRYLSPQAKEMSGLKNVDVDLKPEAIEELINKYCRESGVRNLKKHIEKLYRKSALKIVQDIGEDVLSEESALTAEGKEAQEEAAKDETDVKDTPETEQMEKQTTENPREPLQLKVPEGTKLEITKDNLKDYVGPPVYLSDRLFETYPPGVAMGLAYTSMGGSALFVESVLVRALSHETKASLSETGMLKSVMKESSTVAWTFVKGFMARKFPKNNFFRHAEIHLHFPEGAVRKDGPSAGITMATALMSLALNRSLDSTIAMTGELTVTGKVLRIGGLREKTVAARRVGCKKVLFPKDNLNDWLELPENIKSGIEGCPINYYDEVFDIMFPDVDAEAVNKMYLKQLEDPSKSKKSKKTSTDDAQGELEGGVDGNIPS